MNYPREFINRDNIPFFSIINPTKARRLLNNIEHHLIFRDITMPIIDGLRKNPKFKYIPIIRLTADTGMIDRMRGKIIGATNYMTKPFS